MGRRSKYSADQILDAARQLLARHGPGALSIRGVASHLGAPSGSIYHRFRSRDILVASLWLRAVENFQEGLTAAVGCADPKQAVRAVASLVLTWSRENKLDARLLLMHRSRDLLSGSWPPELASRNQDQRIRVERMIDDLCRRLSAAAADERRRVVFAAIDLPYGAVRAALARGEAPSPELDAIVDDAVVAIITDLHAKKGTP